MKNNLLLGAFLLIFLVVLAVRWWNVPAPNPVDARVTFYGNHRLQAAINDAHSVGGGIVWIDEESTAALVNAAPYSDVIIEDHRKPGFAAWWMPAQRNETKK